MADNYLEKRMADHVSGAGARRSTRRRSGYAEIKFPAQSILLAEADCAAGEALLTAFSQAGIPVGFTCADRSCGSRIAQSCGGRFYPMDTDEAIKAHSNDNCIDTLIVFRPDATKPNGARRMLYILDNITEISLKEDENAIIGTDLKQIVLFALTFCNAACTISARQILLP